MLHFPVWELAVVEDKHGNSFGAKSDVFIISVFTFKQILSIVDVFFLIPSGAIVGTIK